MVAIVAAAPHPSATARAASRRPPAGGTRVIATSSSSMIRAKHHHRLLQRAVLVRCEKKEEGSSTLDNLDSLLAGTEPEQVPEAAPAAEEEQPKYNDDGVFIRKEMSAAQKEKLRQEYLGFGGGSNTKMGSNYFLYIIIGMSGLSVLLKLMGILP